MLINDYQNRKIKINLNTQNAQIESDKLTVLPALIDPHVHFRMPGHEHKEDWQSGAWAALAGGYTTVFDMPNNSPSVIDEQTLNNKKSLIEKQLRQVNIPINYYLFFGATADNIVELDKVKNDIIGVKVFMGSSTGNLLVDKKEDQKKIFKKAAELNLIVAVHAEDEGMINNEKLKVKNPTVNDHSKIRNRQAAIKAVQQAIELAAEFKTKSYICHVSTKEEIEIIKQAKKQGIKVYAEVTPHHLFLNENDYDKLGALAQMNPPLRTADDNEALWQAINENIIDTIGTDHAPHTLEEKNEPYPQSPSGVPGIETCLPLLLDAHNKGKITLQKIIELTRINIQKIFNLPDNNDYVMVDLGLEKEVRNENLKTKCGWSPFNGWKLKGWPVSIVLSDKIYDLPDMYEIRKLRKVLKIISHIS